ncbi:MAG: PIN domain-containing protein [Spirochaetota bacterium]
MIYKTFLDTNLWIYALIDFGQKDKQKIAKQIISSEENEIYLTTQVVNEISFQVLKNNINLEEEITDIIHSFYDKYIVINMSKPILLLASQVRAKYSFSFWDSQIIASALHAECSILYCDFVAKTMSLPEANGLKLVNPFY